MIVPYPPLDISSFPGLIDDDNCADKMFDICSNYSNKYICEGAAQEFFHKDTSEAIKLLHVNCRSIDKKLIAVENLLSACNSITAMAVTENWLTAATKEFIKYLVMF